jgi:branched-chain amino acid transport system permease protein
MAYFFQILLNGIHSGALYALLSYGYVLTYLVTKRANIAHGAMFAFSGQMFALSTNFAYNVLWIILPLAIGLGGLIALLMCALVLFVLAQFVFPPLISRMPNAMITASLAVSIVLMESARIASSGHDFWLPPILANQIHFGSGLTAPTLTLIQVLNIGVIVAIILSAEIVLIRSIWGRRIRAVADDSLAASLCGINVSHLTKLAIIAGGLFALIGGVIATIYYGNMSFGAGLTYGLKVLFIASAGGFSRPLYAAIGALTFGICENLWDGYFPIMWREALFYCVLAIMLCMRTEGQVSVNDRI